MDAAVFSTFEYVVCLLHVLWLAPHEHIGEQEEVACLDLALWIDLLHEALVQVVATWFVEFAWIAIDALLQFNQPIGVLLYCLALVDTHCHVLQALERHLQRLIVCMGRVCFSQQFLRHWSNNDCHVQRATLTSTSNWHRWYSSSSSSSRQHILGTRAGICKCAGLV
jgi:hypothetical protein